MISSRGPASAVVPFDTTIEAHDVQADVYRRMEGHDRLRVMFRLNDIARRLAVSGIRARHPDYDEERITRAYARLTLGGDIVGDVWPGRELVDP